MTELNSEIPETEGFFRQEGYIYVIIDLSKPGHTKIGGCGLGDLDRCLSKLNDGSSMRSLRILHTFKTFDINLIQVIISSLLQRFKIKGNEWFYIKEDSELNYMIHVINDSLKMVSQYNIKDKNALQNIIHSID